MSCKDIMNSAPPVLQKGTTVADALALLRQEKRMNLPVTDAKGRYLGLFGAHQILMLALPKGARADDEQRLAFIADTVGDVVSRLKSVAAHPVERYMDSESETLTPDTPLVETLHILYLRREDLPVVDPDSQQLVGIVTIRSSLGKLMVSG